MFVIELPEGPIARGHLTEECLNFCSRYLKNIDIQENGVPKNDDANAHIGGPLLGKKVSLDGVTWIQAHRYILGNLDAVELYRT